MPLTTRTSVRGRVNQDLPDKESETASTLRLVAVMEATSVTGAAKSMLDFCRAAREHASAAGQPPVEASIITFQRGAAYPLVMDDGDVCIGDEPETVRHAPNEFVAAARSLGLRVDLVGERFRFDPRTLGALREAVGQRAPHLVLTHHVKSHFLMRLSGLPRRYPWAAYHHGYTSTDAKMLAYNRLDRISLPAADRVVTVCDAFARELVQTRGVRREKIFVQHNSITKGRAVSAEEVRQLKSRLGLQEGERVVLTIGRLSREKAQADLVRAFALLVRANAETNARLVIVGDGPERESLEMLVSETGLNARVVFAGQSSDVAPFYAAADVFALPSHSEGSPYVLLEAMAAGVPVVATSVGGVPEIVANEESGLLVAARDEEAFARALARLFAEPELARTLKSNASALVATRYAPATFLRSLTHLYRETVAGTNKRGE